MRSTHNRRVIEARIEARLPGTPRPKPDTVGTNVALRVELITPHPDIHTKRDAKRHKGRGLVKSQRDSTGRRSAWALSPYAPRGGWR